MLALQVLYGFSNFFLQFTVTATKDISLCILKVTDLKFSEQNKRKNSVCMWCGYDMLKVLSNY